MNKSFEHQVGKDSLKGEAEEYSWPHGKAVLVRLYDADGGTRRSVIFANDPERDDYQEYQRRSLAELMDIAIERFKSGGYDAPREEDEPLTLMVKFNDS